MKARNGLNSCLVLLAGLPGAGFADSAQDVEQMPLDELVVTAPRYVPESSASVTKSDIPLLEAPQAVSVISRDQIDVLSWQNLEQSIRYSSGVVGENYGADERYDWITLRGFAPTQFIDGLQSAVTAGTTSGIDLYGFSSIEVLKGPSSALYGKGSPGGLVNLTSRRPQTETAGELQLQYGSQDHRQVAGDATGALNDANTSAYRITGLYRERGSQVDRVDNERTFLALALAHEFAEGTRLTFLSHYQQDEGQHSFQFLPVAGVVLPNPNGKIPRNRYVSDPRLDHFEREQYDLGYEFEHSFNDHVSFQQGAKYASLKATSNAVFGNGLQPDMRTLNRASIRSGEDTSMIAVDSRVQAKFNTGELAHTLLVGIDYRSMESKAPFGIGLAPTLDIFAPVYGQQAIAPAAPFAHPDQTQDQIGIYVQDHARIHNWVFTGSIRQDELDTTTKNLLYPVPDAKQDDSELSYRAGINYVFDFGLSPYVAYSRSFMTTIGTDIRGNPFEPTIGTQFEAGLKFEPRNAPADVRSFMSLAAFQLTQENVLTQDPTNPFFSVQTGEVEVKGLEIEGVARIRERLSLNASYTYTDSEVTRSNNASRGKQLPTVPKHKASMFVDYTSQTGTFAGLGAGVGVRYLEGAYGDAANVWPVESTTLVDVTIHYDRSGWRMALNGNNLFDDEYVARCSGVTACFYGTERTVVATLTRKW